MNKTTLFLVFLLNLVCIINANAQEEEYAQYEKTTSIDRNERYHLVAECDGKYYCANSKFDEANKCYTSFEITINENNQFYYYPLGKDGFEISPKDNGYKILSYNGSKYCTIENGKFAVRGTVSNLKGAWTLTFQDDDRANFSFTEKNNTYTLVFDKDNKRFVATKNYDSEEYVLPYIYGKVPHLVANIKVTNTHWTTFYADYDVKLPSGIHVYRISSVDKNGSIKSQKDDPIYLMKHSPVLIYSEQPGTFPCYETNKYITDDLSKNNYLCGTSTDQMIEAEDGYSYYMLTYGTINNERVFGFFYGAENGGPFINKGGKAYLAVPTAIANQVTGFSLSTGNDDVTSIGNEHYNKNENQSITTLSGVRLKYTDKSKLPSGIYIIDGKKVIVK